MKVTAAARWLYINFRASGPKNPSAFFQPKNSMLIEWTSQASALGSVYSVGIRLRFIQ